MNEEVDERKALRHLLTPQEVADILRRPLRSIYELVAARRLVAIRDGRRLKFRASDIDAYIESHALYPSEELRPTGTLGRFNPRVNPDRESGGVL